MCSTGLEEGKDDSNRGNELPDRKRMREVKHDRYKHLGVLQFDFIMNREMKEKVKNEYIRRVKKSLRSQLNEGNVIAGMNALARYY